MGLPFAAAIVAFYFATGPLIRNMTSHKRLPSTPLNILAGFESRLYEYGKSDKRKRDIVIVGPSYAASIGNAQGVYNLGLISGYPKETEYVIERYCRPEDQILYIVNLHEAFNWDAKSKILRREVRNRVARRLTIFRTLLKVQIHRLSGQRTRTAKRAGLKKHVFSTEDLRHAMNNPRATERMLRQFEMAVRVGRYGPCLPDGLAKRYSELLQKYSNITYVFLPIIPDLRYDSNDESLNRAVRAMVSLEKRLIEKLAANGIDYVDLRDLGLENMDYVGIFHLTKEANRRILEHLQKIEYPAKQKGGVGSSFATFRLFEKFRRWAKLGLAKGFPETGY